MGELGSEGTTVRMGPLAQVVTGRPCRDLEGMHQTLDDTHRGLQVHALLN